MVGVNIQYWLDSVLRFDHQDFLKALRLDLGPCLGDFSLWVLTNRLAGAKVAGDAELKKKLTIIIDMVEKYLESGLEILGQEKKYNFMNKYGPKKCPDLQVKRSSLTHLYSW